MAPLASALTLRRGPAWANRLTLAPLTNCQSFENGVLSKEEEHWLSKRGNGGFGMTMTCAAHVQAIGKGFPGQLGCFDDALHLEGLTRLAKRLRDAGTVSSVQLHHAGMRTPSDLIDGAKPVCASDNAETGARGLSLNEVLQLEKDFIAAAKRAETAGFDGVQLHGAHGYIVGQFLSSEINVREDVYGGSLTNRMRLMHNILDGIRASCNPEFQIGVRLSPERFGMNPLECADIVRSLYVRGDVDYIDISLWDARKKPVDKSLDKLLWEYFSSIEGRGTTRLGGSGKLTSAADAQWLLDAGADFVAIGRGAIVHHDFAARAVADASFEQDPLPVTEEHLAAEGLSPAFIKYMRRWKGFVAEGVKAKI